MENTTPSPSGVKMYLLMPLRNAMGKKTIEVVEVAASTASETSMPPFSAASCGGAPISIKRKMFSSTTTESSMRRENASANPPRSMVLIEPPIRLVRSKQMSAERGMESMTANVARGLPRKIRIMSPVENKADAGFLDEIPDGELYKDRLVEDDSGFERLRNINQVLDTTVSCRRRW